MIKKLITTAAAITLLTACNLGDERGKDAVEVCRSHGGVVALDDSVVICQDQSEFEVEEDE